METEFSAGITNEDRTVRSSINLAERIDKALLVVAKLLKEDDVYLPVFLRLEQEAVAINEKEAALNRAMRLIN